MNLYQEIELYEEPLELLKQWREKKIITTNGALMKDQEIAFICGLIKKYSPRKLVEVGVAAGGTSAVILKCIELLKIETQMYSVDLAEKYYFGKNEDRNSGYLIDNLRECDVNLNNHKLLLGKVLASRLNEIGDEIDFLILDTTHCLPGEILDFLAVFPSLSKDAVVVLHDVRRHFSVDKSYATGILFSTVVADKFVNNAKEYPNIAAFRLNEDTSKYIMDIFAGLLMPWSYMPSEELLIDYEAVIFEQYPDACIRLYNQAKLESKQLLNRETPYIEFKPGINIEQFDNILLYGTKKTGTKCLEFLKEKNILIKGFVVSDGFQESEFVHGFPVYEFSKIPFSSKDTLILLTNGAVATKNILKNSIYQWAQVVLFEY